MLIIAKVAAIAMAIFVLAKTTHDFKKKKETLTMFIFWYVLWWGVIVLTLFPRVIDLIFFQGRSGVNTFLGLTSVFLLYLCYRIYIKADRVERTIQHLVRELALKMPKEK
jgi:hypothetical protein